MTTVRYTKFLGLDKSNDPVKHRELPNAIELVQAENVNLTRQYSIERRDGYSLFKAGSYKSVWGNNTVCYAVNGYNLVSLTETAQENIVLSGVGPFPMRFEDTQNGWVYFTNGVVIGKVSSLGVASALGTSSDEFKAPLPAGNSLAYIPPYLLVARGKVLYISDPINRDVYHQHMGFIQFDSNIVNVFPIGKSMFVSDSRDTWFLRRMDNTLKLPIPMFKKEKVVSYPALNGNVARKVEGIKTATKYYPEAVMWTSKRGVCIGGEDGGFENLTEDRYDMPVVAESACAEFRQVGNLNLFITAIKGV